MTSRDRADRPRQFSLPSLQLESYEQRSFVMGLEMVQIWQ